MQDLLADPSRAGSDDLPFLVTLGLNHEQQHQELLLTDIKHVLAQNPLLPAYREADAVRQQGVAAAAELEWHGFPGGVSLIGAEPGRDFVFDNETPRHRTWLEDFEIADRPVSNREFREFIEDGGYRCSDWWLSDGWALVQSESWRRPMYWQEDLQREFTLGGPRPIDPDAPACHLSYYEADAYARWAGARLPTEQEWEAATAPPEPFPLCGRAAALHPSAPSLYGAAWQWTSSSYAAYPGYRPPEGAIGEYNGKFMCSQYVLRGSSCATPAGHARRTYRNFFPPNARWQLTGIRLAKDDG
jgi:ergothioneine biosynthesis protein EgtB